MFFTNRIINVGHYNITELVLKFFNIKRYGIDFQPINVTIADDNYAEEYIQSMTAYVILAFIVFLSLQILMIIICVGICAAKRKSASSIGHNKFCLIMLIIFNLITVLTFGFGITGLTMDYSASKNICTNLNASISTAKQVRENSLRISTEFNWLLTSDQELVKEIKFEALNSEQSLRNKVNEIVDNFDEFNDKINSTLKLMLKYLTGYNLDENLQLNEKYQDICGQNHVILLIVFISLIVLTVMILLGVCFRSLRGYGCFFAYLMFILTSAAALMLFIVLIIASDVCINFDIFILKNIPDNDSNVKSFYEYYLRCPDLSPNKTIIDNNEWENFFIDIENKINNMEKILILFENQLNEIIGQYCEDESNEVICSNLQNLNENNRLANPMITFVRTNIFDKAHCKTLSPFLNNIQSNFCTNIYQVIFYIFINAILSSGQYYLLSIIIFYFILMF